MSAGCQERRMVMSDLDLIQYAVSPIGVGDRPGLDLVSHTESSPGPTPELTVLRRPGKPRSRPNKGRVKRTDRTPPLAEPPLYIFRELGIPIPPLLRCLPHTPRNWRRGPGYLPWRKAVFAMWGTTCHLCGHAGANTADHIIPLSVWSNQPYDPRLARPAHGIDGCATCHIKCNSSRGNKQLAIEIRNYKPPIAL